FVPVPCGREGRGPRVRGFPRHADSGYKRDEGVRADVVVDGALVARRLDARGAGARGRGLVGVERRADAGDAAEAALARGGDGVGAERRADGVRLARAEDDVRLL